MVGALALTACNLVANGAVATVVRFTGSTAFRSVVHAALQNTTANGGVWDSAPNYGYNGTSGVSGANSSEFLGTIGGTQVLVKCAWAGSEAGIQTVAQNGVGYKIYFVDNAKTGTPTIAGATNALLSTGLANIDDSTSAANQTSSNNATPNWFEYVAPDACFSDTFQKSSQFNTAGTVQFNGATYNALTAASGGNVQGGGIIGIIPFEFVVSGSSTITNMTSQLFKALCVSGNTTRGQFFGNTTDNTKVTLIGRDTDSGTRLTALAETGVGSTQAIVQYYPYTSTANMSSTTYVSGTGLTVSVLGKVPASTVDGVSIGIGNGGYNSGGNLSKAVANATTVGDLVTYLGASDGNNATNAVATSGAAFSNVPAKALSFNGITPSTTAIENGVYTFWGYEHVYFRSGSPVSATINSIAGYIAGRSTGAVAGTVYAGTPLPGNISYNDMIVGRNGDGSAVTLN